MTRTEVLAELEALRRRLYEPDASPEDRERFDELRQQLRGDEDPLVVDPPNGASPRRRRRLLIVAGGVVLVIALGSGIAVAAHGRTHAARDADPVPVVSATPVPGTPSGTGSPQRAYGSGSAAVALEPPSAPKDGTLIVVLSSSDPAPIGWRAERRQADGRWSVVGTSAAALRDGVAQPTSVTYRGDAPRRIVVQAAHGTGWTLTVALLSSADAPLH